MSSLSASAQYLAPSPERLTDTASPWQDPRWVLSIIPQHLLGGSATVDVEHTFSERVGLVAGLRGYYREVNEDGAPNREGGVEMRGLGGQAAYRYYPGGARLVSWVGRLYVEGGVRYTYLTFRYDTMGWQPWREGEGPTLWTYQPVTQRTRLHRVGTTVLLGGQWIISDYFTFDISGGFLARFIDTRHRVADADTHAFDSPYFNHLGEGIMPYAQAKIGIRLL